MCFQETTLVRAKNKELGLGLTIVKARFNHSCGFDAEEIRGWVKTCQSSLVAGLISAMPASLV